MEKPHQPSLSDFDITGEDLALVRKVSLPSVAFGIAAGSWVFARFVSFVVQVFDTDPLTLAIFIGLLGGCFFLFLSTIAGFLARETARAMGKMLRLRFSDQYRRASAFETACQTYEKQRKEYAAWLRKGREDWWRSLSGVSFEVELGNLFSLMGYRVEQTPATGDGGVDLLLRKGGRLTVVQCKAHAKKIPIGVFRELSASMADFKAHEAVIACFEGVTKPVRDYIKDKPISVLTVGQIVEMQRKNGGYTD